MLACCAAVTADEFPDTATVRRKVGDFERNFVAVFCDAFQCLAPLNQLAAVSIATRPDRANQAVSLLQYLESDAIPVDLLTATDGSTRTEDREFFLTIDPARHVIIFSVFILIFIVFASKVSNKIYNILNYDTVLGILRE